MTASNIHLGRVTLVFPRCHAVPHMGFFERAPQSRTLVT